MLVPLRCCKLQIILYPGKRRGQGWCEGTAQRKRPDTWRRLGVRAGRNKTARTVAVRQGEAINAAALSVLFRHIIANNGVGGWRKLKRER